MAAPMVLVCRRSRSVVGRSLGLSRAGGVCSYLFVRNLLFDYFRFF